MSYTERLYRILPVREPIDLRARTARGLRRKVERALAHGAVLEAANVAEASAIVQNLGLWPGVRPSNAAPVPDAVKAASSRAWARQEDRLAARDKLRSERDGGVVVGYPDAQ